MADGSKNTADALDVKLRRSLKLRSTMQTLLPFLGIYTKQLISYDRDTCTPRAIAALIVIVRKWLLS